jgi:hypothetical protein
MGIVWVLRRVYRFGSQDIFAALEALLDAGNVVINRPAVDADLAILNAGGDFADGLKAYEGSWLGGKTFCPSIKRQSHRSQSRDKKPNRLPSSIAQRSSSSSPMLYDAWSQSCSLEVMQGSSCCFEPTSDAVYKYPVTYPIATGIA